MLRVVDVHGVVVLSVAILTGGVVEVGGTMMKLKADHAAVVQRMMLIWNNNFML